LVNCNAWTDYSGKKGVFLKGIGYREKGIGYREKGIGERG